jgi:hypothetical protein
MPTVIIDEVRSEVNQELVEALKLVAESAFDQMNVTARYEDRAVKIYRLYSNVIIVDTSFAMSNLSSERRSWTVRIERDPSRETNIHAALRDARELSRRLYAWGLAWPLVAKQYIEQYAWHQGLGALNALRSWLEIRGIKSEIVETAYEVVKRQLSEAYEMAIITDPVRRIMAAVEEVVEEARRYMQDVDTIPSGWHASEDGQCIEIYLETLRRKVREKLRYLHEITVHYERDAQGNLIESVKQSQWYRVDPEADVYLREMRKFLAVLRQLNYTVYYDGSRNYRMRVCSQ